MHPIDQRLHDLNITLPSPSPAVANYMPYQLSGEWLTIAGQLPMDNGHVLYKGHVGDTLTIEQAQEAARLCAINILAQVYVASGKNWERLQACVRLGGFIACKSDFIEHPRVMNGASDLIVQVLGELGRHARVAVGVNSLPLGAAIEIDATFRIHP